MDVHADVAAFVARETWLLNTGAWEDWTGLFTPSGAYWMPLSPGHTNPKAHVSLMYETAALRAARIQRLAHQDGLSVETPLRSVRHISSLMVETPGPHACQARASVMMAEYVRGRVNTYHGTVQWHLQASAGDFRIELKRVDLINAEGVLSDMLTYI